MTKYENIVTEVSKGIRRIMFKAYPDCLGAFLYPKECMDACSVWRRCKDIFDGGVTENNS